MRAVVQRVSEASVTVRGDVCGAIGRGLLVYLSAAHDDADKDASYLADKVRHLRIFNDEAGQLNYDLVQTGGSVLVISAFTVLGDARKGRRPSYATAARPEQANQLYTRFGDVLESFNLTVRRGVFRAHMKVTATNDGPVCILLDSTKAF